MKHINPSGIITRFGGLAPIDARYWSTMRPPLFLLITIIANVAYAGPSIKTLWKARALEAFEKIEGQDNTKAAEQSPPQRLEAMLDLAYAMHAAQPEIVHKQWAGDGDAFHILMPAGAGGFFDIIYLYEANGSPGGVRIDALPKGWMVIFHSDDQQANVKNLINRRRAKLGIADLPTPQPLSIGTDYGALIFDLTDPFNAFVLERELNIPSIPSLIEKTPTQPDNGLNQSPQSGAKEKTKPSTVKVPRTKDGQ